MKEVTICDETYPVDFNSLTYVNYRRIFNRGIFQDLKLLEDFIAKQVVIEERIVSESPNITEEELSKLLSRYMIDSIDEFIEAITRMAYIGIVGGDDSFKLSYEKWLKKVPRINTNDTWIVEVTELAVSSFC